MNKKTGMYSSLLTLFAVSAFAVCMILGIILKNDFIRNNGGYFSSIFIMFGFIPMICSYIPLIKSENKSFGLTALSFSIMYGVLIIFVYYAQLTINFRKLSDEANNLFNYSRFGLFFNYDLLGYMFMALSTFFIGLALETKTKEEKILKILLCIHGAFAVCCFILPLLGIFNSSMKGGDIIGTSILIFWCLYFIPICILSYRYFMHV